MNSATTPLLDAYLALRNSSAGRGLPPLRPAALQQTAQPHTDPAALWPALVALTPTEGWLQFQSHQTAFHGGLPAPAAHWGALLQAEAVTADGVSLAVRRPPAGGWVLLQSRHLDSGDLLCDVVHHLAHDPALGALTYRRYWTIDPELGAVQTAACFAGFSTEAISGTQGD